MKPGVVAVMALLCALLPAQAAEPAVSTAPEAPLSEQLLREQKHFLECLAVVYHPAFWLSYNGSLYFQPKDEAQRRQLEAMKAARSNYHAFTEPSARHAVAAQALSQSGVTESWQRRLLLPYSEVNPNLTPTLAKGFRFLSRYAVVQKLGEGDALLKDGDAVFFVMDFGHGATDDSGTNACLVREGTKVYSDAEGQRQTLEAFTDAGLSRDQIAVLLQASAGFRKAAGAVGLELADFQSRREFAEAVARANDRNPSVQYDVAMAYFAGKGTAKNDQLGLEWMRRAARNGSGEAKAYLDRIGKGAE